MHVNEDEIAKKVEERVKAELNLATIADEIFDEYFQERARAVRVKVRQVIDGVNSARIQVMLRECDLKAAMSLYEKGLAKLDQLRKGNWSLVEEKKKDQTPPQTPAE